MGRTLKRVPLDFSWPKSETWHGYLNPYYKNQEDCEACEGRGYAPEALRLSKEWYGSSHADVKFSPEMTGSEPFSPKEPVLQERAERNAEGMIDGGYLNPVLKEQYIRMEAIRLAAIYNESWSHHLDEDDVAALIESGRLRDFTHTWTKEDGWQPRKDGYVPTAREVNEWSLKSFGHDAINQHVCIEAKCKRLGVEKTCPVCGGEGSIWDSEEAREKYENWEPFGPPEGEGFQLWETTSEGSPVSPVFETLEELCEWCEDNATTFADYKVSKEEWMQMLNKDFVHARMINQETNESIILM